MAHRAVGWVEFNIAHLHNLGDWRTTGTLPGSTAPEHGANSRDQFARVERLGQVVVSADFQSHNTVYIFSASGQKEYGNSGGAADTAKDLESIQARKHDVEHNQDVISAEGTLEASVAIVNRFHLEALGLKVFTDKAAELGIVVDD